MVSGLVTSPEDQARIFSGEASVRRSPFQVSRAGSFRGVNAIVVEMSNKLCFWLWRQIHWLDIERETANLVGKYCEGCRCSCVTDRFTLHNSVEGSGTTLNIIRLNSKHL